MPNDKPKSTSAAHIEIPPSPGDGTFLGDLRALI